ncbi:hypothetical protein Tco_0161144, partial [Tanacetum coccineum]
MYKLLNHRSTRVISSDEASLGNHKDASKQERKIDDIDKDAEITLVDETQGRCGDEEMFDTGVLDGNEVLAELEVTVKDVHLSVDEVTLAQALAALKSAKDKGKAKMIEPEPVKKLSRKDQISFDEQEASTIPVSAAPITDVETTLAQALAELKSDKPTIAASIRPRAKRIVIDEQVQEPTP